MLMLPFACKVLRKRTRDLLSRSAPALSHEREFTMPYRTAGMCHVGEPDFYRAVQAVMAHAGVVNLLVRTHTRPQR